MKRGRDEKLMEPMFPRLHVNDADKGGPRAPPRNKMALYEQLCIPSQRFHSPVPQKPATSVPHSSQVPSGRNHYENQLAPDIGASLAQVKKRKKPDEDDYTVPIFVQTSQGFDKVHDVVSKGNPKGFDDATNLSPIFNNRDLETRRDFSTCHESGDDNGIEHSVCLENVAAPGKSYSEKGLHPHDSSETLDSLEDGSCNSSETGNLEGGDCASETSVLETSSSVESITPDDVVGLIGQKGFWKARRAIANQQRIFAIQVYELHRLIDVQKSAATSPHLMLEEDATPFSSVPAKALPHKKLPLDSPAKTTTASAPKQRAATELKSNCKEAWTVAQQPSHRTSEVETAPPAPQKMGIASGQVATSSDNCASQMCFSKPQGHQYLIPVMSPSEGLVYKPYPGPLYPCQSCGGCGSQGSNPGMANFMTQVPAPPHCLPPFPPVGPHGYFSPYGMPMMSTAAFSASSIDQMKPPEMASHVPPARDTSNKHIRKKKAVQEGPKARQQEDTEVFSSTASSPSQRATSRKAGSGMEARSMHPFFHAYSAVNASKQVCQVYVPERRRPIRAVPHNSVSATESAARIFRSIQEERKQH